VLRLTLLALIGMVSTMSCASDAGDLAPGPVCNTIIVHGENDETLAIGGQLQLGFLYEPCDINDQAPRETKWSSGSATVATVTSSGLVTGRAVGTAMITASVPGGSAGLEIHVTAPLGRVSRSTPEVVASLRPNPLMQPTNADRAQFVSVRLSQ